MGEFRDVCEEAARCGGRVLRDMVGEISPREKAPKDLVTEADYASQEAIRRVISDKFPEHGFLGEEDLEHASCVGEAHSADTNETPAYCWLVDPLDGTLNYVRQLPNYSVSVALRHGPRVICGVVYDPVLDECFAAELQGGAVLNGKPIAPSSCTRLEQGLVAVSLPTDIHRGSKEAERLVAVMCQAQSIRRMGSAALNLCYVAMGRLDAYWTTSVKIWDIAAGQLLVTEAGGTLTRPDGMPFDLDCPQLVAAGTSPLHGELVGLFEDA